MWMFVLLRNEALLDWILEGNWGEGRRSTVYIFLTVQNFSECVFISNLNIFSLQARLRYHRHLLFSVGTENYLWNVRLHEDCYSQGWIDHGRILWRCFNSISRRPLPSHVSLDHEWQPSTRRWSNLHQFLRWPKLNLNLFVIWYSCHRFNATYQSHAGSDIDISRSVISEDQGTKKRKAYAMTHLLRLYDITHWQVYRYWRHNEAFLVEIQFIQVTSIFLLCHPIFWPSSVIQKMKIPFLFVVALLAQLVHTG